MYASVRLIRGKVHSVERIWLSVGASVFDPELDSFLLIQRMDNGRWELPGGLVEPGEIMAEAVVRETFEETGALIRPLRVSGIYESPDQRVVSVVYDCRFVEGRLRTSEETRAVAWVKRSEVPNRVNNAYSCRILDALNAEFVSRVTDEDDIILCR